MSRTGVEKKPPWSEVPQELKTLIGEKLGSPVVRAERVYGGFGPSPSYRLRLANGKRAFTKSLSPESSEYQHEAFRQEMRVYLELADQISQWAPAYLGEVEHGDWHAVLLEDLGPKSAPPWTRAKTRAVTRGLAEFHTSSDVTALPGWLRQHPVLEAQVWRLPVSSVSMRGLAGLAADPEAAERWLERFVPDLSEAIDRWNGITDGWSLLHLDTRSDNLRIVDGKLRLFDWNFACVGPPELDAVAFAQTVESEGYFDVETVLGWYEEAAPLRENAVTSALALVSDLFAHLSWQPDIPSLPRIRPWQRAQLKVTLRWTAKRLNLPDPEWVDSIPGV